MASETFFISWYFKSGPEGMEIQFFIFLLRSFTLYVSYFFKYFKFMNGLKIGLTSIFFLFKYSMIFLLIFFFKLILIFISQLFVPFSS